MSDALETPLLPETSHPCAHYVRALAKRLKDKEAGAVMRALLMERFKWAERAQAAEAEMEKLRSA